MNTCLRDREIGKIKRWVADKDKEERKDNVVGNKNRRNKNRRNK